MRGLLYETVDSMYNRRIGKCRHHRAIQCVLTYRPFYRVWTGDVGSSIVCGRESTGGFIMPLTYSEEARLRVLFHSQDISVHTRARSRQIAESVQELPVNKLKSEVLEAC